jgi:hypothetical protein
MSTRRIHDPDPDYVDDGEKEVLDDSEAFEPPRKRPKRAAAGRKSVLSASKTLALQGYGGEVWSENPKLWPMVFKLAVEQWIKNRNGCWDEQQIATQVRGFTGFNIAPDSIRNRLTNQKVPKHKPDDVEIWFKDYQGRPKPPVDWEEALSFQEEAHRLLVEQTQSSAEASSPNTKLSKATAAAKSAGVQDLVKFRTSNLRPILVSLVEPSISPSAPPTEASQQREAQSTQPIRSPTPSITPPPRRAMDQDAQVEGTIRLDLSNRGSGRQQGFTWSHQKFTNSTTLFMHVLTPLNGSVELKLGDDRNRTKATLSITSGDLTDIAFSGGFESTQAKQLGEFTDVYKKVETLTFQLTLPRLAGFPGYKELEHKRQELLVSFNDSVSGTVVSESWEYEVMER